MKLREALILRIEEICKERGKTISKLSLNGGMSPSNIYSLNKNRTNKTFVLTIAKFCDGAEISLAEFFTSPLFNDLDLEDEPENKE